MHTEQLSVRLRGLMVHAGIKKKEDLAARLGYSRTQLFMIEEGKAPATERFLAALAQLESETGFAENRGKYGLVEPERMAGNVRPPPNESRLTSDVAEYLPGRGAAPLVPATDAEITGLAALVTLRAAQIAAGQSTADVPIVADALERALGSRGWRVRE